MSFCLFCHSKLPTAYSWSSFVFPKLQSTLCANCRGELKIIKGEICRRCGRLLENVSYKQGTICFDCLKWQERGEVLSSNRSVFVYNDFMKDILARFKFRGDTALVNAFSSHFRTVFSSNFSTFAVVPIPLSYDRLTERGFNQSILLASLLQVPIYDRLLIRIHGEKQSKKTREERITSASPFRLSSAASLPSKHILLIDDIYTTGTTIRQAASLLLESGAVCVSSLTLSR